MCVYSVDYHERHVEWEKGRTRRMHVRYNTRCIDSVDTIQYIHTIPHNSMMRFFHDEITTPISTV